MKTINQAVYSVLEDMNVSSDDSRYPRPYIYSKLMDAGNELLRQDYNNGYVALNGCAQTIYCLELVPADQNDCREFDGDFTVLKSVKPIPNPIHANESIMITGIYTVSGNPIHFGTLRKFMERRKRRHQLTTFGPYAIIRDNYIYVFDYEPVECLEVTVEGYFDNPADVDIFNNPGECKAMGDRPFEYPEYLHRRIIRIVADELRIRLGIPLDNTNNAKDDAIPDNTAQQPAGR